MNNNHVTSKRLCDAADLVQFIVVQPRSGDAILAEFCWNRRKFDRVLAFLRSVGVVIQSEEIRYDFAPGRSGCLYWVEADSYEMWIAYQCEGIGEEISDGG